MQHTPGPWTVDSDDGIDFTILGGKTSQVRVAVEASERDARLIAAAPALLAALEHALERFECIPEHRDESGIYRNAARIARAAIARAS